MYYLADVTQEDERSSIIASSELTKDQYKEIKEIFGFVSFYHTCRSAKNMVLESATDLEDFLAYMKNETKGYDNSDINNFLITGNKLLISFLSFIKTFLDIVSHAISQRDQNKLEDFQKLNNELYDMYFGYRFLTRLRNYVIHYDMPLTTITNSVDTGIQMGCNKEALLNFKKWSTVSREIELLPEFIDIGAYIEEAKQSIFVLYLKALETVADEAVKANHRIQSICKEHNVSSPIIVIIEENEKIPRIEQLPIYLMNAFFEDLKKHPNFKIEIIYPKS